MAEPLAVRLPWPIQNAKYFWRSEM